MMLMSRGAGRLAAMILILAVHRAGAEPPPPGGKTSGQEPPVTREAACRRAVSAPQIDGRLDDRAW
jgi:hypothetical protein